MVDALDVDYAGHVPSIDGLVERVTWADRTGVATSTTSNVHVRIAPFVDW
jgi:hypothetical protein